MKTWFFTEDAYPYLPDPAEYESIRVNLPNRNYDPAKGADLYHMYLDMWLAAEGHGLEIMVNEHHQTATCVVPAAPLLLAILARQSKTARLLILGNPIANRNQPVRVAEEMAMIEHLAAPVPAAPSAGLGDDRQRHQRGASGRARLYRRRVPGRLHERAQDLRRLSR